MKVFNGLKEGEYPTINSILVDNDEIYTAVVSLWEAIPHNSDMQGDFDSDQAMHLQTSYDACAALSNIVDGKRLF